ncbi:conserved oligomeric Golgi complex subunit 8-like [Ceratina calcarata]|uniref:Conserved oligomeric Golgi complex subunit 8-like n=1 Tax=Ceratina calcarata TaxID=156304 RepID=A0AAJ7J7S0_9HYME|nr:conserved oligomeric Golgi complex subunit 8-like [Ceratina calcarata]
MLEPLIVLTVLNCFFMFSSTVTTCALWWQYRSHRCCFRRDSTQHSVKRNSSRPKSNNNDNNNNDNNDSLTTKRSGNSKHDRVSDRSKSNSTVNRENDGHRCRRNSRQKAKTAKYLVHSKTPSDEPLSSLEIVESWELEDGARMSEASQTGTETKPAVVMEYSTVQKIVQILDDDTDLTATKMVIKDLAARQNVEEKKEYVIVRDDPPLFEPRSEIAPLTQVQFAD